MMAEQQMTGLFYNNYRIQSPQPIVAASGYNASPSVAATFTDAHGHFPP